MIKIEKSVVESGELSQVASTNVKAKPPPISLNKGTLHSKKLSATSILIGVNA